MVLKLSKFEHDRWVRYMIANGWVNTDSSSRVIAVIRNGAPRHNLSIAKLHPLMCRWEDLAGVYSQLHACYKDGDSRFKKFADENTKAFQEVDRLNIQQTGDILRAKLEFVKEE